MQIPPGVGNVLAVISCYSSLNGFPFGIDRDLGVDESCLFEGARVFWNMEKGSKRDISIVRQENN